MKTFTTSALAVIVLTYGTVSQAQDTSLDPALQFPLPGVRMQLVAEHPDVMTPTGIDVDQRGRVWVAVSHTHFRPDDYQGPEHDEIVILDGSKPRQVFYSATDATMDLELGDDGWVYLAERDRILRVRDTNGDDRADEVEDLAVLTTDADYPHNGLAGLAWHPDGDLIFSLGENYWLPWTLKGTDGATVSGTGEGGVFRCRRDGKELRRIARGFWNPFGICVRPDGEMFAAENDPGARPPCRLLHVVPQGDYGYQRLYGRAPFHPFVAWNGELRGTLPMLHATGEAPCGIVPLGGGLLVPSWADHRIDFYPLRRKGASYETHRLEIVTGADAFRPTCIVQADEQTYFLSDWVEGSYDLHGKGRVWKLEIDFTLADWIAPRNPEPPNEQSLLADRLRNPQLVFPAEDCFRLAKSADPFLAHAALLALSRTVKDWKVEQFEQLPAADRVHFVLALRKADPQNTTWATRFLNSTQADVQFEALRWIADEQLRDLAHAVEKLMHQPGLSFTLFEACLATANTLSGNPRLGVSDPPMLLKLARDQSLNDSARAYAVRLIPPDEKGLKTEFLAELTTSRQQPLVVEAVRSLAARSDQPAQRKLLEIAQDTTRTDSIRADAVAGIRADSDQKITALLRIAKSSNPQLRDEALRSLRFAELNATQNNQLKSLVASTPAAQQLVAATLEPDSLKQDRPAPQDLSAWQARLRNAPGSPDPEAGRRLFYRSKIALCANCHRRNGRGQVVGPDLSAVGGTEQEKLLSSILEPSRHVDPQYYAWTLVTTKGQTFTGILLRKGGRSGKEFYRDNQGREQAFLKSEIELRREQKTSLMPDGLFQTLTDRELRDLIAYLQLPSH